MEQLPQFPCAQVCAYDCEHVIVTRDKILNKHNTLFSLKEIIALVVGMLVYRYIPSYCPTLENKHHVLLSILVALLLWYMIRSYSSHIIDNAKSVKNMCLDYQEQCNCNRD